MSTLRQRLPFGWFVSIAKSRPPFGYISIEAVGKLRDKTQSITQDLGICQNSHLLFQPKLKHEITRNGYLAPNV
jgi:hypothetical protein